MVGITLDYYFYRQSYSSLKSKNVVKFCVHISPIFSCPVTNKDQGWMWAEKGNQPIRPKGLGRGLMVSDIVDEFNGLLSLTAKEFERGKLEYPCRFKTNGTCCS